MLWEISYYTAVADEDPQVSVISEAGAYAGSGPEPPAGKRDRRVAFWLLVAVTCVYILCHGGTVDAPDGAVMYRLTESLVKRQSFSIEPLERYRSFGGAWHTDERTGERRFYPKYGPALAVLAVPGYVLGSVLVPFAREEERGIFEARLYPELPGPPGAAEFSFPGIQRFREVWYDVSAANFDVALRAFFTGLTNCWIAAGTVAMLFLLARRLGSTLRQAVAVALLAGFATPLWFYAKTFFAEPLGAFALSAALLCARIGFDERKAAAWWGLSGAALGLAVLAKPANLIFALPGGVLVSWYAWTWANRDEGVERKKEWAAAGKGILAWGTGLALCVALFGVYNLVRFGSPLETGYGSEAVRFTGSFRDGLLGLLVSPGRGLFVYCPLALLSVIGARRFFAKHRGEGLFVASAFVVALVFYAGWYEWDGGWCWGPRFLMPVVPLLVLPACEIVVRPPRALFGRVLVGVVVGLSTLIAFSGTLVHFIDFGQWLKLTWIVHRRAFLEQGITDFLPVMRWDPLYAPVLRYWDFPVKDYFLVLRLMEAPGVVMGVAGLTCGFLVVAISKLWTRGRSVGEMPDA